MTFTFCLFFFLTLGLTTTAVAQAKVALNSTDRRIDVPNDAKETRPALVNVVREVLENDFPHWFNCDISQLIFDIFLQIPGRPADSRIQLSVRYKNQIRGRPWSE